MAKVVVKYELEQNPRAVLRASVESQVLGLRLTGLGFNNQVTAGMTHDIGVYMGADRSGQGVHARGLWIQWTDEPPEGYNLENRLFVPILRRDRFRSYKPHQTGLYLNRPFIVVGKRPEVIR